MGSTVSFPEWVVLAALVHLAASSVTAAFQLALALGAPWGRFAMGGAFPGRYPPALRIFAVVQAGLLVGLSLIVLSQARVLNTGLTAAYPWLVVLPPVVAALAVALNAASRSADEKRIWVPVGLVLLATSVTVTMARLLFAP